MSSQFWEERYQRSAQAGQLLFPKDASDAVVYALKELIQLPKISDKPLAVDIGAGEGRHARHLATLGYQVIATEISPTAVAQGSKRFRRADGLEDGATRLNLLANDHYPGIPGIKLSQQVTWQLGDCRTWKPDEPVDLALGAFIHQVPGGITSALANICSWLKPGGFLVLVGHSRQQFGRAVGGPKNPDLLWLASELAPQIAAHGLTISFAQDLSRPQLWELSGRTAPTEPLPLEKTPVETILIAVKK